MSSARAVCHVKRTCGMSCQAHAWRSNGPRAKRSRRNTGFPPCRKTSASPRGRAGQTALAHRTRLSGAQAEIGLGRFEGRGWRGFHHHATLCIGAYGYLICERQTIPPSGPSSAAHRQAPRLSRSPRPDAPPLRTERHVPDSIATMRRRLAGAITRRLSRCPCCAQPFKPLRRSRNL